MRWVLRVEWRGWLTPPLIAVRTLDRLTMPCPLCDDGVLAVPEPELAGVE